LSAPHGPVPDGGGGGSFPPSPVLTVSPLTINLGTAVAGGTLSANFTMRATYGAINYGPISSNDVDFTVSAPLSGTIPANTTITKTIQVTKPGAGTYSAIISIPNNAGATIHINVTAHFVAAGATLVANPAAVTFNINVLGAVDQDVVVVVSNNTGAPVTITGIVVAGIPFACPDVPPITINDGTSHNFTARAHYTTVGIFSGSITFQNALADVVVALYVTVEFLFSVNPLLNTSRAILMGFVNAGIGMPKKFDGTDFDGELNNVLIFNGTLWDNPGNEKVLRRLQVFYENVGVCTGLKLDVKSWRPTLTPPPGQFDTVTRTITIGNANADSEEMSAFFDVELAGELIVAQLTRLADTGSVSILGFIPHFEDKGEKVESV